MLPGGVAVNSVQFEMESWTGAQRAFAVKSFYKNNDSYVAQREFRKKFGIHRNSKVPLAHAIKTWVNNFEETGSTVKRKGSSVKTVRTPQNIWRFESGIRTKSSPVGCASFPETGTVRKQSQAYFTLEFALRIQEDISRIPVDVLGRAMSSVHDWLAECGQRNGGHLEDVTSGMMYCVFFLFCVMFQDQWFTYFCTCYSTYFPINVAVSRYPKVFIFSNTLKSPDSLADLVLLRRPQKVK